MKKVTEPTMKPTMKLSANDAALLAGVCPESLRYWARTGKIRCHRGRLKNGRRTMTFELQDVLAIVTERKRHPETRGRRNILRDTLAGLLTSSTMGIGTAR